MHKITELFSVFDARYILKYDIDEPVTKGVGWKQNRTKVTFIRELDVLLK